MTIRKIPVSNTRINYGSYAVTKTVTRVVVKQK